MFTFEKISERDVDFIIMREFANSPEFADIFLNKVGRNGSKVTHIEHSMFDVELGESDITVIINQNESLYGLLIENKIDAQAMPEQYARYCKRGENGIKNQTYSDFAVFITAPQAYLDTNPEAQKYPHQIPYETLLDYFTSKNSTFEQEILRCAIHKQKSKYVVQEVPSITLFWNELYSYAQSSSFDVEMYPPKGAKGIRSTWPQFRVPLKGTVLFFKSEKGYVDLEFSGKLNEASRLQTELSIYRKHNMHWRSTGKSLSLRIKVEPIDFTAPFNECIDDIDIMLHAVEELTAVATKLNDINYVV